MSNSGEENMHGVEPNWSAPKSPEEEKNLLIERTIEDLNHFLVSERAKGQGTGRFEFGGATASIQAGPSHYSEPADVADRYSEVEIGFPSETPPSYIMSYQENPSKSPTESVYAYVPIELAVKWIVEKTQSQKALSGKVEEI